MLSIWWKIFCLFGILFEYHSYKMTQQSKSVFPCGGLQCWPGWADSRPRAWGPVPPPASAGCIPPLSLNTSNRMWQTVIMLFYFMILGLRSNSTCHHGFFKVLRNSCTVPYLFGYVLRFLSQFDDESAGQVRGAWLRQQSCGPPGRGDRGWASASRPAGSPPSAAHRTSSRPAAPQPSFQGSAGWVRNSMASPLIKWSSLPSTQSGRLLHN